MAGAWSANTRTALDTYSAPSSDFDSFALSMPASLRWSAGFNTPHPRLLQPLLLSVFYIMVGWYLARAYVTRCCLYAVKLFLSTSFSSSSLTPSCPSEFTCEFLTRLLRARGVLGRQDEVDKFHTSAMGMTELVSPTAKKMYVAQGQVGAVVKLHLRYSGPTSRHQSYPATIVVKSTSEQTKLLVGNLLFNTFCVERWVYTDALLQLSSRLNPSFLSIPQCYGAEWNAFTGRGWILLEDLEAPKMHLIAYSEKDIADGKNLPMEHLHAVVDALVEYHQVMRGVEAQHFAHAEAGTPEHSPLLHYPQTLSASCLVRPSFLSTIREQAITAAVLTSSRRGWKLTLQYCEFIQEETRQVGSWLFDSSAGISSLDAAWRQWMRVRPEFFSIAHGDVSVGNIMFREEGSGRPLVLFDHQLSAGSRPLPCDLAHFLLGNTSFCFAEAEVVEAVLLERYFRQIPQVAGMSRASREQAWEDYLLLYRTSLLYACILILGLSTPFYIDGWRDQNRKRTAGEEEIPLAQWPMGRRLIGFAKRMQQKVKQHRLHEMCAEWTRMRCSPVS